GSGARYEPDIAFDGRAALVLDLERARRLDPHVGNDGGIHLERNRAVARIAAIDSQLLRHLAAPECLRLEANLDLPSAARWNLLRVLRREAAAAHVHLGDRERLAAGVAKWEADFLARAGVHFADFDARRVEGDLRFGFTVIAAGRQPCR